MQDIRQWENKPSLIDLSVATKVAELITKLVSFQQSQPISGDTTRPERKTRALKKIALSCARKVLTFLIGEILSLREILPKVPTEEGSLFLDFTPNERRHNKYRRGRGILSSGSRSWNAILFRIRKFSKFLHKPSDQYSDTQQTTAIDQPIGTVTNLQSVSAEINQTGIDSLSEYIGTASEKGLAYRQDNKSGSPDSNKKNRD